MVIVIKLLHSVIHYLQVSHCQVDLLTQLMYKLKYDLVDVIIDLACIYVKSYFL